MFNYLKGIIVDQESNFIVLENNGIGFEINVANPYSYDLNQEYQIFIYNHVKEEEYSLYGFKNKEEKDLFLRLINVKGLGPKMAMPMLATGSVSGIVDAIERENILYLKKFPKIGDKVARQIILDLKGKLTSVSKEGNLENSEELINVLTSLGYKNSDIKKILPQIDNTLDIEQQIKDALKLMLK